MTRFLRRRNIRRCSAWLRGCRSDLKHRPRQHQYLIRISRRIPGVVDYPEVGRLELDDK